MEFKKFEDEMPVEGRWILVTNNLSAKKANGEMSHLWLTALVQEANDKTYGLMCFAFNDFPVYCLTHWKYV